MIRILLALSLFLCLCDPALAQKSGNKLQVSDGPYPQCVCSSETVADTSYCACVLPAYQDPDVVLLAKQSGGETLLLASNNADLDVGDCVKLDTGKGYNIVYSQAGCTGNWNEILSSLSKGK